MNGRTIPARQKGIARTAPFCFNNNGRCHAFLPSERNRENHLKEHRSFVKSEEEQSAIFAQRFLRSYRILNFIACRVLGDEERAPIAIQNCWKAASRNPPHFEYEGAFRSWLVRVLIDEALAILHEKPGRRGCSRG
jgi:hypothetical protein